MDLANGWAMDAQGKISVLGFVAGDAARITVIGRMEEASVPLLNG